MLCELFGEVFRDLWPLKSPNFISQELFLWGLYKRKRDRNNHSTNDQLGRNIFVKIYHIKFAITKKVSGNVRNVSLFVFKWRKFLTFIITKSL